MPPAFENNPTEKNPGTPFTAAVLLFDVEFDRKGGVKTQRALAAEGS